MSRSADTLRFHFPSCGDAIFGKINALREEHLFCDVTLLLGGLQAVNVPPLRFPGHKVVLAASSDFLRDQFLLHEGLVELSVGVVASLEVGKRLLLSCYTGRLEVPLGELVSYLTAASALQMTQVVEKCAQAVSQYLSPTLAFLRLEDDRQPEESLKNQTARDATQSSARIQAGSIEVGRAIVVQSKLKVSQGAEAGTQGLKKLRDDGKAVQNEAGLPEETPCFLATEEVGEIQLATTKKSTYQKPRHKSQHLTDDQISSLTRGSSGPHSELLDSSQDQDEETGEKQKDEEDMFSLAAQMQEGQEMMESSLCCVSGAHLADSHWSGDELTEGSESVLVQRPYLCRRCDRVFQHLRSYVGHLKEHRKYMCLVCGKGFSQKSNLTHHIRSHTDAKPLRCPLCHKTFSQNAKLQDHLSLHTGDKSNQCECCAVHFAHKQGLRRHLKDVHSKSGLQNMLEEPSKAAVLT